MASSISVSPPRRSMSKDTIWVQLQSSLIVTDYAYLRIECYAATTPGDTIGFAWGGNELTFTIAASPDASGLQIPESGALSNADYAEAIAPYLRQNETLHTDFNVSVSGAVITLTYRYPEALTITMTATPSGISASPHDVTGFATVDNLRALVEVWSDTGDEATDASLGKQHSPYSLTTQKTDLDLSPAFAGLSPYLPPTTDIPPSTGPYTWQHHHAASAYQKWYLRHADKYGTPPVAEALLRYAVGYVTFYGANSPAATRSYADLNLRHAYFRRDGLPFYKPIGEAQPDWVYCYNTYPTASTYFWKAWITWSDGNTSEEVGGFNFSLTQNHLYAFPSGPGQLEMEDFTPPSSGATVYSYRFAVMYDDKTALFNAFYTIDCECADWGLYLLYDNGLAGCETAWLRGKKIEGYASAADVVQRIRPRTWQLSDGEFEKISPVAQSTWACHSGWHDDDYYLTHLRQCLLANRAWIVDTVNRRFLPVTIETAEVVSNEDDQDLHGLELELRAAWLEQAANI